VVLASTSRAELHGAEIVEHPFVGITHITRTEAAPRNLRMHIVQIDLAAPGIRFELTPPGGTLETVRQTTLGFLADRQAQVAVNGHYFLPFPSASPDAMLIGLAVSNGNVYSAFEWPAQAYAIVKDAPALNIDPWNDAAIVHRDLDFPDGTRVLEDVTLWNALAGSAQIVTDGVKTIPDYADAQNPEGLLTPGGPGNYSNGHSWYDLINARTAVALTEDAGTLILFTVDNAGGSLGMSVGEVADVLIDDYGAWDALNLDGGGSTTLAMEHPVTHVRAVVNVSADNPAGRPVGSSLSVFAAVDATPPPTTTVEVRLATSADDAEETVAGGVNLTSTDLELVDDNGVQTVGMRFAGVPIPDGATILAAWVQFQVDEVSTAPATLSIAGEAVDTAAAFTTTTRNVSRRARTAASTPWVPEPWPTIDVAGPAQRTPDLSPVVQEIVARPGWTSGNALALIATGTGKRVAEACDGLPTAAALLHVEYVDGTVTTTTLTPTSTSTTSTSTSTVPASTSSTSTSTSSTTTTSTTTSSATTSSTTSTTTPSLVQIIQIPIQGGSNDAEESASGSITLTSTDLELVQEQTVQKVGMRFVGVGIPRGAAIDLAYVQFQVDETGSGTTNLTVTGQSVDDAPAFGTSTGNISSRLRTSAVTWANIPSWPTVGLRGTAQRTADLKPILQQIVNRGGWASGNAIVIIVEGTGKRVAASSEIGPGAAPTLVVQFRANGVATTTTTASTTTMSTSTLVPATTTTTTRPPTTTGTSTTSTSTTTSSTTTLRVGGGTSVYQAGVSGPAGSANVDTNVRLSSPTTSYGTDPNLYVGVTNGADKVYRSLLAFHLGGIPANAVVTSCRLTVNVTQRTSPTAGRIRRVCGEHWLDGDGQGEAQATWNSWKAGSPWGAAGASSPASCAAGGDTTTTGEVVYAPPNGTGLFAFPDLSALCQDALAQRGGWLRVRISQDAEATPSNLVKLDSSDAATAANRPKLTVSWSSSSP
jgi:hypothetical protein